MSIITAVTVLVVAKREISLQDDALWHAGHIATTPTTAEQCIEIKGDIYTAAAAYRTEYHDLDRRLQQRTIKANVEAWYQHNCGPRP
ncbi:hypothetical protein [Ferrimonas marina]|nr:hypothetical protein [Ferrimonas marina]